MAKGAPQSFVVVYKTLSPALTRFIVKRLGTDYTKTEEILQSTAIAAWKSFNSFKHKSTYFTWLCRIALNKIADYYRDQINHRSRFVVPALKAMSLVEANDIPPVERMALKELCDKVNECLDLMPTKSRKLLWFKYWQGLSHAQIAKLTGLSERAVEGRLYRARSSFAQVWNQSKI